MNLKFLSSYLGVYFLVFFTVLFVCPLGVLATSPNSLLVNVVPENPTPKENTNITLSSYASNLDSVLISWSVDGKNVLSGVGKKSLSLAAPAAGIEKNVVVAVSLPDGVIKKTITIKPSVLVLLWQANDSYVPPFYRGKALPTPDSQVKVVALPEVRTGSSLVNPKKMTYSWKKDYTNNQDGSGYGKNYFIYSNDYLDDSNNIGVKASTADQQYSSGAEIDIAVHQPKIIFYKKDAGMGTLWEKALKDGNKIVGDEIIEAAPYFISPKELRNPALVWNWTINDNPVEAPILNRNLIPVTTQAGISGISKIKLEISNLYKIFETANKEIYVEF